MMPGEWDWMQGLRNPFGGLGRTPPISPTQQPQQPQSLFNGPPEQRDAVMAMAAQLLAGSGPSPVRKNFGQLIGEAMQAGQQAKQQSQQNSLQQRYLQSQITKNERPEQPFGNINPAMYTPESVAEFQKGGGTDYSVLRALKQSPGDNVGNYNPGDYTPETWAKFVANGYKDPSILQRYTTPREQSQYYQFVQRLLPDGSTQQGVFDARRGTTNWSEEKVAPGTKERVAATGTAVGTAEGAQQVKGVNAGNVLSMVDEARKLLPSATGSLMGAGIDAASGMFGHATSGAKANARLKVLQSNLMLNMPRMEGPQSDRDVGLYKEATGLLGDPTSPVELRGAALDTIEMLQKKYQQNAPAAPGGPGRSPAGPQRVKVDAQGNVISGN